MNRYQVHQISNQPPQKNPSQRKRDKPQLQEEREKDEKAKIKVKERGKGKRSANETDDADNTKEACGVCMKFHIEGEEWIYCDAFSLWYHRDCVGLDDNEWNYQLNDDAVYICPMCI